ncbi:GPW/gp25 family protein [Balneolaceae bacterium ANBcel3]|nr:GPW/gp25 family protein [Balneolaceae bacterium ANBcel3]
MITDSDKIIGKGWHFPPAFSRSAGKVEMTEGLEDIKKSLEILFSTIPGERVMRPDYGSDLRKFLYEPLDETMKTHLRESMEDAILYHEPRIRLIKLDLVSGETTGELFIHLSFEVKGSNSRFNHVFPFYKEEGSDIKS